MHRRTFAERYSRVRRGRNPLLAFVGASAVVVVLAACNVGDSTTPGSNQSLSKSSGDSQTVLAGRQPAPLVVKVMTGSTPQSGITVNWTTTNSGVTLNPTTSTTDANGVAQTTFLSQKAGKDTVRANTTSALVAFLVTVIADTNTAALFASGGNGSATLVGVGVTLTVKSADAFGNPRPNVTVNFAAGAGLLSKTTVTTDANGQAATIFTPGPGTGTYTVQATANGYTPITFSVTAI